MVKTVQLFLVIMCCVGCENGTRNNRVLEYTGRSNDLSLVGEGLFQLQDGDGVSFYADSGNVFVSENLTLGAEIDGKKFYFSPAINIPHDTIRFYVETSGDVFVQIANERQFMQKGKLPVVLVRRDSRIEVGNGLFKLRENSLIAEDVLDSMDTFVCCSWLRSSKTK